MFEREGVYRLRSHKEAINTAASPEAASRVAQSYNTREYLEREFFGEHERMLGQTTLEDGSRVSVVIPTGPYSEEAVLVMAAGSEIDPTKTASIYDLSTATQAEYWKKILKCLEVFHASVTHRNQRVAAVENNIKVVTNPEMRTSRTIVLPHTHIIKVDLDALEEGKWRMSHLRKEQFVLRQTAFMQPLLQQLQEELSVATGFQFPSLTLRHSAPYGYSFEAGNIYDVPQITSRLAAHHQAYTETANSVLSTLREHHQRKIIPQPSYRSFLEIKDGEKLIATISPECLSPAGVMEAAGIKLERGPEYPQRKTSKELAVFFGQVTVGLLADQRAAV
ncbi:MAG: hypothetical protein M3Q81_04810 [bacterium]|nr:hypothetical protein [bacterium]